VEKGRLTVKTYGPALDQIGDNRPSVSHCGVDDLETCGLIEQHTPCMLRKSPVVPWCFVHGPCLMSYEEHEPSRLQNTVNLNNRLPWHSEMVDAAKTASIDASEK
jgi:hypothetical protein